MPKRQNESQKVMVRSRYPLTEDQKRRFLWHLQGEGRVDHRNRYVAQGATHTLAVLHVLDRPLSHISHGETRLDGLDDLRFSAPPCLYLQSQTGEIHGWQSAREEIRSAWHCGVILADTAGDLWFCGRDQPDGSPISGQSPILRRIAPQAADRALHENGRLDLNIPASGEFYITDEDPGVVTSIPWWSRFDPVALRNNPSDRDMIVAMIARADAAGLDSEPESLEPG